MMRSFFFVFFLCTGCLLLCSPTYGQTSTNALKKEGDRMFLTGDYRSALKFYRQAGLENSGDEEIRLRLGISLYEINDLEGAAKFFQSLINEGKTDPIVFYWMARIQQSRKSFQEAITLYKRFLQRSDEKDTLRTWVTDELIRCANGARLIHADQPAYIENAGTEINTQYDELGVKNSPTIMDKIYFNSNRPAITSAGIPNMDLFSASLVNGRWSPPVALPPHINSPRYDEVIGFSSDGQVLYYLTSANRRFQITTDTFSSEEGVLYKGVLEGPFTPSHQGSDLFFFNDTICIFSSNTAGGYGGFDLYISVKEKQSWSAPLNLGPTINTFYDERFPFLTKDGQTLFYSSNSRESMGGFDVFRSVFDPNMLTWSWPQNLGFPINSALDDTHIALSPDGMTAFLSSDRKEGHGGYDIYRTFFKQPIVAHQQISSVPTFYQVLSTKSQDAPPRAVVQRPVEIKEYFISPLFIDEGGEVLAPQNIKKLDLLANLLLIYPAIKLELSCFTLPGAQRAYNLFFSVKEVETAAEYLAMKGIQKNRLLLKGYGSSFPLAKSSGNSAPNSVANKLNHRMEFTLHGEETEPVLTHIEQIPVPNNLKDPVGLRFTDLRHGLYYSVQIASITQMLQNPNLETIQEIFVDVDYAQGYYKYMAGVLPDFVSADERLAELKALGFGDAFIVAYIDGQRISVADASSRVEHYPDLKHWLDAKN